MENEKHIKEPGEWQESAQTYQEGDRVKHEGQEYECKGESIDKSLVKELIRGLQKERFFERAWWIVVAIIAIGTVGWAICCQWIEALCSASWLFVAWMYWRRQKAIVTTAEMMLEISRINTNQERQIDIYQEMVSNYKKIIAIQTEHLKYKDEKIEGMKHHIECQDTIIDHYKKEHP